MSKTQLDGGNMNLVEGRRRMAVKKSDLYASLWASCDELRGGMDASQYKDYVLVLLFVKYVSDRYGSDPHGDLTVPKGGSFADMVAAKNDPEIGDRIDKVLGALAKANPELKGVIDVAYFNDDSKLGSGQEKVDRLTNLIGIFQNPAMDFSKNQADGDDLLGDAYEYLMRHFATQSGKSKGQFYTPAEISRVLAAVVGVDKATEATQAIYDPTCGSGSLLMKAFDTAKKATGLELAPYGQEMDNATAALATMNAHLHNASTTEIHQGNTLASPNPAWTIGDQLKTFDYIVANPPFSSKTWRTGFNPENDRYRRFEWGVPPNKNGDYAFLLHIVASLKSTGSAAVILPHGVLFRGGSEAAIRRAMVKRGYIRGLIGLPPNLFYGTGIGAVIVVLDKKEAAQRKGIFMIDASKGFAKDGPKNRLRERDIHRIVDVFTAEREVTGYARMVPIEEIAAEANNYNLNLPRYIDSGEPEDIHDLEAHLQGGIPDADIEALDQYWQVMPGLRNGLFKPGERAGYSALTLPGEELSEQIRSHPEFGSFQQTVTEAFESWGEGAQKLLSSVDAESSPRDVVTDLGESLLEVFEPVPLIDEYAAYQRFREYWEETLKDDLYLVVELGWLEAARPQKVPPKRKNEKKRPTPHYVLGQGRSKSEYRSELLPAGVVVERFMATERASLEEKEQEIEFAALRLEELAEEQGGDEGLLSEVINEEAKVLIGLVKARAKELQSDGLPDEDGELALLEQYLEINDQVNEAKAKLKEADAEFNRSLADTYEQLDETTVVELAVNDKWLAAIRAGIDAEVSEAVRRLDSRIRQLANRYDSTLGSLVTVNSELEGKVSQHLERMGIQ
jgi:type I restriction enzyme M protein